MGGMVIRLLKNNRKPLIATGLILLFLVVLPPRPGYSMSTLKTWVNKVRPGTFPELEAGKETQPKPSSEKVDKDKVYTETERELLMSLMERKRQIDERETLLNQREEQLRALRDNIQHQISELKKTQGEIEASIEAKKAQDEENLKKVVDLYNKMDAKKGANKLQALETKIASKVLMRMNQRKAAAVLAEISPDKAKAITEEIVRKVPEGK